MERTETGTTTRLGSARLQRQETALNRTQIIRSVPIGQGRNVLEENDASSRQQHREAQRTEKHSTIPRLDMYKNHPSISAKIIAAVPAAAAAGARGGTEGRRAHASPPPRGCPPNRQDSPWRPAGRPAASAREGHGHERQREQR
jgi:hypothetical protein